MSYENKGSIAVQAIVSRDPDRSGNYICNGTADEVDINRALSEKSSVLIKRGNYTLAAPITPDDGECLILEDGVSITQGTAGQRIIDMTGTSGDHIVDVTILALGTATLTGVGNDDAEGIYAEYIDRCYIGAVNALNVTNIGTGAVLLERNIDDCVFEKVKCTDWGGRNQAGDARIGFSLKGGDNDKFIDCEADGTGITGGGPGGVVACFYSGSFYGLSCHDLKITRGRYENSPDDNGIYIDGQGDNTRFDGLVIDGSILRGCPETGKAGIKIKSIRNFQIKNVVCIDNYWGLMGASTDQGDLEGGLIHGVFSSNDAGGVQLLSSTGNITHHIRVMGIVQGNGGQGINLYISVNNRIIEYIDIDVDSYENTADNIRIDTENDVTQIIRYVWCEGKYNNSAGDGIDIQNEAGISNIYFSNGCARGNGLNVRDAGGKATMEADFIVV